MTGRERGAFMQQLRPGDLLKPADFDPDRGPDHPVNRLAAKARRVTFDVRSGYYKDEDGRIRYDFHGQPL